MTAGFEDFFLGAYFFFVDCVGAFGQCSRSAGIGGDRGIRKQETSGRGLGFVLAYSFSSILRKV
jgi:hypothetical protein